MKRSILVVDDNQNFSQALSLSLASLGQVTVASRLSEARELGGVFDLMLLDYELPDGYGYEIVKDLRERSKTGAIFLLSGVVTKDVAKEGFRHRIDGILEKPFSYSELQQKLETLGWFDRDCVFNDTDRTLTLGAQTYSLTETEFTIVQSIRLAQPVVTRDELTQKIWGGRTVSPNALDTHLTNLKAKIPGLRERIKSIRGRGYRWSMPNET